MTSKNIRIVSHQMKLYRQFERDGLPNWNEYFMYYLKYDIDRVLELLNYYSIEEVAREMGYDYSVVYGINQAHEDYWHAYNHEIEKDY